MKTLIALLRSLLHARFNPLLWIAAFIIWSNAGIAQDLSGTYRIVNTYPGEWNGASLSWDTGSESHPMASVKRDDPVEWRLDPVAGPNTYMIVNTRAGEWKGASLSWDGGSSHPMASVEKNDPVEWRFDPVAGKPNTYMIVNTYSGEWNGASLSWDGGSPHPMASVEKDDPVEWRLEPVEENATLTSGKPSIFYEVDGAFKFEGFEGIDQYLTIDKHQVDDDIGNSKQGILIKAPDQEQSAFYIRTDGNQPNRYDYEQNKAFSLVFTSADVIEPRVNGEAAYKFKRVDPSTVPPPTVTSDIEENATPTSHKVGDLAHGGIVFWVDAAGTQGLVMANINQYQPVNWYEAHDELNKPSRHDAEGSKYLDWRMPSKWELNKIWQNLADVDGNGVLDSQHLGGFRGPGLPPGPDGKLIDQSGYPGASYWSSTESNEDNAWSHLFNILDDAAEGSPKCDRPESRSSYYCVRQRPESKNTSKHVRAF